MKLGELIRDYRLSHDCSQRQLAIACGLSNGYISILEKGINPNTGKPVTPTIPQLKKLSSGIGMTLMELLDKVDDMPIDIGSTSAEQYCNAFCADPAMIGKVNIIRILTREGLSEERYLNDQQLSAIRAVLDQMPNPTCDN